MSDTAAPAIKIPTAAEIEKFVETADSVLGFFSAVPQVAFVHKNIVPLLEGGLTIMKEFQSGTPNPTSIAAELDRLKGLFSA